MIDHDAIVFMAREAGMPSLSLIDIGYLKKFAALVAEREREACAEILDRNAQVCTSNSMLRDVLEGNAAAIRARKN